MALSHEMPVNRDNPITLIASRSSVAPVKPKVTLERPRSTTAPQHPARRERQARLERVEAQRLDARWTPTSRIEKPASAMMNGRLSEIDDAVEPPVAPDDGVDEQQDPPPRGHAEEIQQQIGEPGADAAARVVDAIDRGAVRPAGVAARSNVARISTR